jgi:putative transposase
MNQDNIIEFKNPEISPSECVADLLTSIARQGAIKMLATSIEFEVSEFIKQHQSTLDNGHNRLVRNGYLPERTVQTGVGDLPVKIPRVRDKNSELNFTSSHI